MKILSGCRLTYNLIDLLRASDDESCGEVMFLAVIMMSFGLIEVDLSGFGFAKTP